MDMIIINKFIIMLRSKKYIKYTDQSRALAILLKSFQKSDTVTVSGIKDIVLIIPKW
jgi:hypothetical protein